MQKLLFRNVWGFALKNVPVRITGLNNEEHHVFETDEKGALLFESDVPRSYRCEVDLDGKKWTKNIEFTQPGGEHHLRIGRPLPNWLLLALFGAWVFLGLFFIQTPYCPSIRLVDGYTEQPIPLGLIQYQNQDGFNVKGTANSEGIVQLYLGRRRLYEAIYQLNDEQRIVGTATGYLPNPTRLHMRTWYWCMDLPLYTGFVDSLDVVVVNASDLEGIAGRVLVDCIDCVGRNHWELITDEHGRAQIPIDRRFKHRLIPEVPGAIPVDTLYRTGDLPPGTDTLRVQFPVIEVVPEPDENVVYCPDRVLVFQVCNSNGARDDLFNVYINGTSIGRLDLTSNELVSTIFVGTDAPVEILEKDFDCPLNMAQIVYFNSSLVHKGVNTIELRNVRSVKNGNKGTIGVRNYEVTPIGITNPCRIADVEFKGESGDSFHKSFIYEQCCPFDEGSAPSD